MEEISGTVEREAFAKGSKSERPAVVIRTAAGRHFVLRRAGGNAFSDPVLDGLVGKRIRARGDVAGYTFLMQEWREIG